jgi:ankyrin repeat protein
LLVEYPTINLDHVNRNNQTALHLACLGDQAKTVAVLASKGTKRLNSKDSDGNVPLHYLVRNNDCENVATLVASGADVNAPDKYGCTPLHIAALSGSVSILQILLDNKGELKEVYWRLYWR